MGIVWEAYHKRVPLLGVPENPIDSISGSKKECRPSPAAVRVFVFQVGEIENSQKH